jgi:putative oxidoreductase
MIDVALLFLRISIGILMLGHAVQKLFGWFGGGGIAGTFKLNQNLRLRPVWLWVVLVLACETGGSLLLARCRHTFCVAGARCNPAWSGACRPRRYHCSRYPSSPLRDGL